MSRITSKSITEQPYIDGLDVATDEIGQAHIWNYYDDMATVAPSSIQLKIKAHQNAAAGLQLLEPILFLTRS